MRLSGDMVRISACLIRVVHYQDCPGSGTLVGVITTTMGQMLLENMNITSVIFVATLGHMKRKNPGHHP